MKKTAKSSKTIRANKRKAKLKAKHRRQRARGPDVDIIRGVSLAPRAPLRCEPCQTRFCRATQAVF